MNLSKNTQLGKKAYDAANVAGHEHVLNYLNQYTFAHQVFLNTALNTYFNAYLRVLNKHIFPGELNESFQVLYTSGILKTRYARTCMALFLAHAGASGLIEKHLAYLLETLHQHQCLSQVIFDCLAKQAVDDIEMFGYVFHALSEVEMLDSPAAKGHVDEVFACERPLLLNRFIQLVHRNDLFVSEKANFYLSVGLRYASPQKGNCLEPLISLFQKHEVLVEETPEFESRLNLIINHSDLESLAMVLLTLEANDLASSSRLLEALTHENILGLREVMLHPETPFKITSENWREVINHPSVLDAYLNRLLEPTSIPSLANSNFFLEASRVPQEKGERVYQSAEI